MRTARTHGHGAAAAPHQTDQAHHPLSTGGPHRWGVKGYQTNTWNSLVVPRGTPAARVQQLNREVVAVLNQPDIASRLRQQGIDPEPGTPADLTRHIRDEIVRFQNLIKVIGLKPE